jgi:hypothetical protein
MVYSNLSMRLGDSRTETGLDDSYQRFYLARMSQATQDEKYHLITRRLQEVLGGDSIKTLLAQGKTPKCYWGACSSRSRAYCASVNKSLYRNGADWQT